MEKSQSWAAQNKMQEQIFSLNLNKIYTFKEVNVLPHLIIGIEELVHDTLLI
jgi:hypothetical protein